jgi:hypothetical protein
MEGTPIITRLQKGSSRKRIVNLSRRLAASARQKDLVEVAQERILQIGKRTFQHAI